MDLIYNMKIRTKLLSSFILMSVFMGIIGYTGFQSVKTIEASLQKIFTVQMPSIDSLIEADRDLQQLQVAERSLMFTEPGSQIFKNFLKDYNDNFSQSDTRWKSYKKLATTEKEKQLFSLYETARSKWEISSGQVIELAKKADEYSMKQAKDLSLGKAKRQFEQMRDYIDQLTQINLDLAKQSEQSAKNTYHRAVKILVFVILLGVVIGMTLSIGISKLLTEPVNAMVAGLKDIAQGEGDLTKRLNQRSKNEIGELASWFNTFMDKLQGIIKNTSEGVTTLSSAATDLSGLAGEMTQGTQSVSSTSDSVTTATQELNSSMDSVAAAMEQSSTNTDMIASAAEEMNSTIKEIAQNAENARSITERAVEQANDSTRRMNDLGGAAEAIGNVVETINDISEQVNLLSLNATIEAARAGEAGKGFAVVANEIKDLASQTSTASLDIGHKITSIQKSSSISLSSIMEISKIISEVNDIVSTIAAAIEEQSAATREIAENIIQVSSGIQEANINVTQSASVTNDISKDIAGVTLATANMAEMSQSVDQKSTELTNLAADLHGLVKQFKV